jgi:hypothetical protein
MERLLDIGANQTFGERWKASQAKAEEERRLRVERRRLIEAASLSEANTELKTDAPIFKASLTEPITSESNDNNKRNPPGETDKPLHPVVKSVTQVHPKSGKRLYTKDGGRFVTSNIELKPAIMAKYNWKLIDNVIFSYIAERYDAYGCYPVICSYYDLTVVTGCVREAVRQSIIGLIRLSLIERVNNSKGRAKSGYIPNVDLLHKILIEHMGKRDKKQPP